MSDNETPAEVVKKARGWPKGKPRVTKAKIMAMADRAEPVSMLKKMKARPNWEGEDFVGAGIDGVDRLKIPDEIVDALRRDGMALQWITRSVRGMETPQEVSRMTRGGWTPVHQEDFDGLLDGLFMPKGHSDVIGVDDCMLVARPVEIDSKARSANFRQARRPLQVVEDQIGHGIPGVTGSDVHRYGGKNTINKSFERIEFQD